MKDFDKVPKNRWVRLIRKKWFLPAVYIAIAAIVISAVVWYQTAGNPWVDSSDLRDELEQLDESATSDFDEEAQSVMQQEETIKMPVEESMEAEIVTKFYDYEADREEQEKGLTLYNNRYYQSTGIDIAQSDGEAFDVIASLSGTVTEVKEDPLLGNVVTLSHGESITTHYASLAEVNVDVGDEVSQGEKIGVAGKNMFNESGGTHVHFELHKDGIEVNPEDFFNKEVSKLEQYDVQVADTDQDEATEDGAAENEEKDETKEKESTEQENERKGTKDEVSFSMTT